MLRNCSMSRGQGKATSQSCQWKTSRDPTTSPTEAGQQVIQTESARKAWTRATQHFDCSWMERWNAPEHPKKGSKVSTGLPGTQSQSTSRSSWNSCWFREHTSSRESPVNNCHQALLTTPVFQTWIFFWTAWTRAMRSCPSAQTMTPSQRLAPRLL